MSKGFKRHLTFDDQEHDKREQFKVWPFTVKEFIYIRNNLKSSDLDVMEKILKILQMWQWRCNDSQSSPIIIIDLTKLILQGLTFDQRHVIDQRVVIPDPGETAQLVYGSTLARFVNYIHEMCMTNKNTNSMAQSAESVGIPFWVVRLRHDVVHVNLPSLEDLRRAALFCRDWLFDVHWSQQIEIAFLPLQSNVQKPPEKPTSISSQKIHALLMKFCNLKMIVKSTDSIRTEIKRTLLNLKSLLFEHPKVVIETIANSFIIKTKMQMREMKFEYDDDELQWKLPPAYRKFWEDVIIVVQEVGMAGSLMNYFAKCVLDSEDTFKKSQFSAWLSHFIGLLKATDRAIPNQNLLFIAERMLKSKEFYKLDDFLYVLNSMHPELSEEKKEQLLQNWYSDKNLSFNESALSLYTLDEIDNSNNNFALVAPESSLGLIFDQTKESLDLNCLNFCQ